ncbi:MAG: tyrosine-protein phosphatase, partial [Actinobacteria bacterium]|nr:tyrosine-protein phosphatase [Actinomycetota bacterium]
MKTADRNLDWPGFLNARDLGGLATDDGRQTRRGVIVRSDMLNQVSRDERSIVLAYGVRSVLDLRMPDQVSRNPSPFAAIGGLGIAYHNISFPGPIDSSLP